jgi:hypothetical protein
MPGSLPALSDQEIAKAAWQNFGDLGQNTVVIMTAIALAESSGIPDNLSPGAAAGGAGGFGLWQIENNHPELGADFYTTYYKNPTLNGRAARKIYIEQGINAWSAFTNGSYSKFLPRAQQAVEATKGTPLASPTAIGDSPGITVDGSGQTKTIVGGKIPDLLNGLFSGLGPALWIGGGAILIVLAIIMLNEGTITQVAKVAAL